MRKIFGLITTTLCFSVCLFGQGQNTPSTYSQMQPSAQIKWLTSYDEAVNAAKTSSKPIVILFTGARWCGACLQLEREVLSNTHFKEAVSSKFIFLKAELIDPSENGMSRSPYKPLIDKYSIQEWPTFVVIDQNGARLFTVPFQGKDPTNYAQKLIQGASKI